MKLFSVHYRDGTQDEPPGGSLGADLILVKEGFSWPAFFAGFLWALANRLWVPAAFFFGAQGAVQILALALGLAAGGTAILTVACAAIIGYLANDLRRDALKRRGYREQTVVLGRTVADGFRRYLDRAPYDVLLALP